MTEALKPQITAIIPTYRRPRQLEQAIRSVLAQTYPNLQVCVYDNASGDETASVVASLAKADPRVKYHCHAENIGALNNFQYGLQCVDTPFFAFLSDDDTVLPEFYETALAGFEKYPEAMFSVTDVVLVGAGGAILRTGLEGWKAGYYPPREGLMAVLEHGHSDWTGILFRKGVIEKVGLLDSETARYADPDFEYRIAAHCPFVVTKRPCAIFDLSMSHLRAPYLFDFTWPGILKMTRNLTEDESLPADVRAYAERALLGRFESGLLEMGVSYLSRGYPADARRVAALLRDHFGRGSRARFLTALIYVHQHVPLARRVFDSLIECRRHMRSRKVQRYQHRYSEYRELVDGKLAGERQ